MFDPIFINSRTRERSEDICDAIAWDKNGDAVFAINGGYLFDWRTMA